MTPPAIFTSFSNEIFGPDGETYAAAYGGIMDEEAERIALVLSFCADMPTSLILAIVEARVRKFQRESGMAPLPVLQGIDDAS